MKNVILLTDTVARGPISLLVKTITRLLQIKYNKKNERKMTEL